jgi:hypothetical protein
MQHIINTDKNLGLINTLSFKSSRKENMHRMETFALISEEKTVFNPPIEESKLCSLRHFLMPHPDL